jgi:hypothetical protein
MMALMTMLGRGVRRHRQCENREGCGECDGGFHF